MQQRFVTHALYLVCVVGLTSQLALHSSIEITIVTFYFPELRFKHAVFPTKIEIFETYNPGCIVRILACDVDHYKNNPQVM